MPGGDGKGPPVKTGGFGARDGRGRQLGGQGQKKTGQPGQGAKTGGQKGTCD